MSSIFQHLLHEFLIIKEKSKYEKESEKLNVYIINVNSLEVYTVQQGKEITVLLKGKTC